MRARRRGDQVGPGRPAVRLCERFRRLAQHLGLVRALRPIDLRGADVVEVSPPYDGPGAITGLLAANILFELLSVIALRR